MPVVDITHHILMNGRTRRKEITDWLTEHVGQYYGPGEDTVLSIGSGWEMIVVRERDDDDNNIISWAVDITDEEKAAMFILRWS